MKDNRVKNKKISLKYKPKIIILIIFLSCFLISSCYFFSESIKINDDQKINYSEKSNIDYNVFLKENDFYEEEVLNKNMSYIANLIDHIKLNFNYNFLIDKEYKTDFTYEVNAKLKIVNPNSNEIYFTKDYNLLDSQNDNTNLTSYNLNKSIDIDYDYYNDLANKFKATYAVDTDSSLVVTLKVYRTINEINADLSNASDVNDISITIPLSQKSISIKMDYDDINNHETIIENKSLSIANIAYLVISIVLLVIALLIIIFLTKIIRTIKIRSSKYDITLRKIRKEYDRLIVDVKTSPDLEKFNITKIAKFEELLDLHDNYSEPIRYIEIEKHEKSCFYIQRENELFLFVLENDEID